MPCNFCQSGGPFAGMLVKALFRWKKDRLRLYLFSLEIEKNKGYCKKTEPNYILENTKLYLLNRKIISNFAFK